jgi:hypothetical protein
MLDLDDHAFAAAAAFQHLSKAVDGHPCSNRSRAIIRVREVPRPLPHLPSALAGNQQDGAVLRAVG